MATVLDSQDAMLLNDYTYGSIHRALVDKIANTTAANSTSGSVSGGRYPNAIYVVPTLGTGITGVYATCIDLFGGNASATYLAAMEVLLGTLTVSGNSFADGSVMPSRVVHGDSIQLVSLFPVVVATAVLTATTPVLTITYKNQDQTASRTATLTLPTNPAVNTAFAIMPHLQTGDTGIYDVTGLSISTGTAGTLKVYGLVPLAWAATGAVGECLGVDPLSNPWPMPKLIAADTISMYQWGATATADCWMALHLLPENN